MLGKILSSGQSLPQLTWDHQWSILGLIPGPRYRERFHSVDEEERGEGFRCDFYSAGRCSIWSARPSECSTYFCQGRTTQIQALSERGFRFEVAMAQHCLVYLGFSDSEISDQVDALNGEKALASVSTDLAFETYLQAWKWTGQLRPDEVRQRVETK